MLDNLDDTVDGQYTYTTTPPYHTTITLTEVVPFSEKRVGVMDHKLKRVSFNKDHVIEWVASDIHNDMTLVTTVQRTLRVAERPDEVTRLMEG